MQVINKHRATPEERAIAVYIGRPTVLQNPFPITDTCDREMSVKLFRTYFIREIVKRNPEILKALSDLKESDLLMCYCKPKACHGDIVKEIWEFFQRSGGIQDSLGLFDWLYGESIKKESAMSSVNIDVLLAQEHPSHTTLDDDAHAVEMYKNHLARMIMTRDPRVENAFREVVYDAAQRQLTPITPYEAEKMKVIIGFIEEFKQDSADYEKALYHFKERHNHQKIDYEPKDDGVTHINVYSKGRTELGRLLSNFGHTPFKHPEYGYFSSIEAFWYWLSLGKNNDSLRSLYGFQAKKEGLALREALEKQGNRKPKIENFNAEIKKAILCKIEQNERLGSLLKNSTLPLTHYYVWGDEANYRVTYPEKYAWIHEYIQDIRDFLNGKAHKLVIAGSRGIENDELVKKCYEDLGIKVIEFVSGTARGPDRSCVTLANELGIPCAKMPADWDKHGKSAGFVRNDEMAKYATFGLIIWDGVSHGTKQMIERCQYHDVQHVVIRVKPKKP